MYVVYVLQDDQGKSYKGMTNNLERRLSEHRQGQTRTTSLMGEVKVIYTEECPNRAEARRREKYLKSAAGRKFLKKILQANTGA
jgi:putative endonuclease